LKSFKNRSADSRLCIEVMMQFAKFNLVLAWMARIWK
jgi:hypothetical protein